MCGIFGYIGIRSSLSESLVGRFRKALTLLAHRGPDSAGEYTDGKIYLGHRRLSIIDLSGAANQPFHSANQSSVIVFNGEIYNYKELKPRLTHTKTNSDTEVILEGYLKFGIQFFKELRGMYAFAIYNQIKGKIILYRDPSGIKPLYYSNKHDFIFASEIKSIKSILGANTTLDEGVLKSYLALGYCIEPYTIYQEIKAVEPGDCIEIDLESKEVTTQKIKKYDFRITNDLSQAQNTEILNVRLDTAMKRNLVADVPVNFALSGGIDSSLLFAKGHRDDNMAISVKFNDSAYDETSVAEIYAKHLKAKLKIITADRNHNNLELLNRILWQMDQPYADSSAVPFFLLSKQAAQISKVLIGGDGGDEIQNGYPAFRILPMLELLNKVGFVRSFLQTSARVLPKEASRKLSRSMAVSAAGSWDAMLCEWQSWFPATTRFNGESPFLFDSREIYETYENAFKVVPVDTFQQKVTKDLYLKRMLSDYLRKSDMMSMMNSLEYRVPMLDEDLVDFSLAIPYAQKNTKSTGKILFRKLHAATYPSFTSSLPKSGFSIPMDKWLTKESIQEIQQLISRSDGIVCNFINPRYVDFLFKALLDSSSRKVISRASVYQRILILYGLQYWYFHKYNSE